jgi:hypothetical protein
MWISLGLFRTPEIARTEHRHGVKKLPDAMMLITEAGFFTVEPGTAIDQQTYGVGGSAA